MKIGTLSLVAGVLLAGAFAWSARAGDGTSLDERVARLEQRLAAVETKLGLLPADLPALRAASLAANEQAAIAALRSLASAQVLFAAAAVLDVDRDGVGEYGGFVELAGTGPGRLPKALSPPVLAPSLGSPDENGAVTRNGFCFRLFLCDAAGAGVGEPKAGFTRAGGLDADLGEVVWCAYAWPVAFGESGKRTFFVNQEGDLLAIESREYAGSGKGPKADAAFSVAGKITGRTASGSKGADGNLWKPL